jgi:hypothetical protein
MLGGSVFAQLPAHRTTATIIADALAQIPAKGQTFYNALMRDLALTGEEGILQLASKLNVPGAGSKAQTECALNGIAHYVGGAGDETLRAKTADAFIKALKATDDPTNKQFVISLLQIVGKDETVDALAPLLNSPEPQVSDAACRAVAAINSSKTALALKTALMRKTGTVENQRNIVVAIGEAQVEGTEELLLALLPADDAELRRDLLYALSRVGGDAAEKMLADAAAKANYGYEKTNATDAYLAFLTNKIEKGGFDRERYLSVSAATQNILKTAPANAYAARTVALQLFTRAERYFDENKVWKEIKTALKSDNKAYRVSALQNSLWLTSSAVATNDKTLKSLLKQAHTPERQAELLHIIAETARADFKHTGENTARGNSLFNIVEQYLADNNSAVRITAMQEIGALVAEYPQTCSYLVPKLVTAGNSDDKEVVSKGANILNSLKTDNLISSLGDAISNVNDSVKVAFLGIIAARRASSQFKTVLSLTQSKSPAVKTAALKTLKSVATPADAETIAALALNADKSEIPYYQQAVIAAIASLPEAEQIALLKQGMAQAGDRKYLYYLPLAATGAPEALSLIQDGITSTDESIRDAAFDALLTLNTKNTPDMLYAVCTNPDVPQYFDRALDAYIRKISNPALTGENRLIFLRKAMEIAKTDGQKNQILKRIQQSGTFLALLYAGEFIDTPALKENAAQSVMNIALNHKEYTGENVIALLNKAAAALSNSDADYQRQSIKKHIDDMPKETGFVPIFNGRDLTGWKGLLDGGYDNPMKRATLKPAELKKLQVAADKRMRRDWTVENGLLAFVGHGYDNLCTVKQYGDFEMYVDWLLDPAGPEADAGIYLRGTPQVQIWDTARTNVGAQVGSGGLYNNQRHASKPLTVADNRLGEWNTLYIKMVGDRVTVKLNGMLVVNNIVLENYWDRHQPVPAVEQIELQAHGSKVYYRNIYVKELESPKPFELLEQEKKEGFTVLFDGTNMHEWWGNLVDYHLEDGCISVHPTSSFGGNLYTKKEYANFVFRFEFQLTPAANNGVGIRAPMDGDNAYNAMEIQILDCEHPVYADIKPWQHHGSVYGVIAAEHGAMLPVGEWNEEEIYADGDHIRVTLNGKVILDGNIREASMNGTLDGQEHPGLLNKSGHIGFLGHGNELKFRNIRIKELK